MLEMFEGITSFVAGKRVVPPLPPGRQAVLAGEDEPSGSDQRDETASLALFIEYRDAKGVVSARRIVCRSYDVGTDMLTAWCFEREALRQFRIDRIATAACTQTGELYDLADLARRLRGNGLAVRDTGLNLVLRFLTFLMRCDGIHWAEEDAIEQAITSYALRFDGDDQVVDQALRQARTMAPDERDFLNALYSIGKRSDRAQLARFIRQHARLMVEADGVISAEEAKFGAELDAVLRKLADAA
jgi:hypothetical protein